MSSQLPIVQYWHTAPPDYITELTGSFARRNPGRPHLLFNQQTAGEFIAKSLGPRAAAAFAACGPPAMQADYLRYCAILHLGGVWSDAEFICLRDLSGLLDGSRGGELFWAVPDTKVLTNGFFAFATPRHPFLQLILDFVTELIERRWEAVVSTVTGPVAVSSVYYLCQAGSVDAFLQRVRSTHPGLLRYSRILCGLIDDDTRLAATWGGIRAHPPADRRMWTARTSRRLPCHDPELHWERAGTDIYSPGAPSGTR